MIVQAINSSKLRPADQANSEMLQLTKTIVEKQTELNNYLTIGDYYSNVKYNQTFN